LLRGADEKGLLNDDVRHFVDKSQISRRKSQTISNTR
jgi:hypothetical protein